MKKKILILLVVLSLITILLVLTGCSKSSNDDSTPTGDNPSGITNEEVSGTGEKIHKIIQGFSGGIALVQDENENQYVINESGKVVYNYDAELGKIYISNGYISVGHYVFDSNGKEILHNENKLYGEASESGYIAVLFTKDDISGKTFFVQIEDLKGNTISESYNIDAETEYEAKFYMPRFIWNDFYIIRSDNLTSGIETGVFDAKTKNIQVYSENIFGSLSNNISSKVGDDWYLSYEKDAFITNGSIINSDFSKIIVDKSTSESYKKVLFNKYIYSHSTQKDTFIDFDKNIVKDFSDIGGIASIEEFKDKIYVISNTGYIYTMDESLNYIKAPSKTEYSGLLKTNKGIYAYSESEVKQEDTSRLQVKLDLLNDNLEVQKTIFDEIAPNESNHNFMTGLTITKTPSVNYTVYGKFIYSYQDFQEDGKVTFKIYDTEKEKFLEMYK